MTQQIDGPIGLVSTDELERLLELSARRAVEISFDELRGQVDAVRFGDEPHQIFTPDWAELVLRELFNHHRKIFAECLAGAFAEVRNARPGPKAAK